MLHTGRLTLDASHYIDTSH